MVVVMHWRRGLTPNDKTFRIMAKHGSVCEFNSALEDWKTYVERLEQYFAANDVTAVGKKRAILLSACGASAYQLIRSLLSPATPNERSFAEIVAVICATTITRDRP